jgi:ribulose-phosphate 3-epimerase
MSKRNAMPLIAPSLICTDLCNIAGDIRELEAAGVDLLHVDLIDAHFSPSMPMGIEVVQAVRRITELPFDVHLMVENNEFFIRELIKVGVQQMCFHYESALHVDRLLGLIQDHGVKAGIALTPATPVSVLDCIVGRLDFVLLMLINPGFAGHHDEKQVPYALQKVEACRNYLDQHGRDIPIEIDGRVSIEGIPALVAAGADILVTGSKSMFHPDGTISENAEKTRQAIGTGLKLVVD